MSKLILNEDYRSLHKWKYATKKPMKCRLRGLGFEIDTEYIKISGGWLTVKARYAWDGASFIARDTPDFMRGSLFHDALCELVTTGVIHKIYRKYADKLLRQHCLEDGMNKFRAWYVYMAVRAYSKLKGMKVK